MAANVKDVATHAGVSPSTVSNFLHRPALLSAASRERVRAAIEHLGYVPNESARQLRKGASRSIALILLDAWLPFYSSLSRGVEDAVRSPGVEGADRSNGWALFFSNSGRDAERELLNIDMFEAHRIQGIIISPQAEISERLQRLQHRGIHSVVVSPLAESAELSSVGFDDFTGGRLAGEHLLQIGRSRIAFLGDDARVSHSANRLAGLRAAVESARANAEIIRIPVPFLDTVSGMRAAEEILETARHGLPDAIFAANDMLAVGAMTVFLRAGLSIPHDVAIVGYDDVEYASQAIVPLTTVRQPAYDMGHKAASMLLDRISGARTAVEHVSFPARLVARESTLGDLTTRTG